MYLLICTSPNIFAYVLINYSCVIIIVFLKDDTYLRQGFPRGYLNVSNSHLHTFQIFLIALSNLMHISVLLWAS